MTLDKFVIRHSPLHACGDPIGIRRMMFPCLRIHQNPSQIRPDHHSIHGFPDRHFLIRPQDGKLQAVYLRTWQGPQNPFRLTVRSTSQPIPTDPNGSRRLRARSQKRGTEHPKPRDSLRTRVGPQPRQAPVERTVQPDPWHRGMVSRACQNCGRVHYRFRMYIVFWTYSMCRLHSLKTPFLRRVISGSPAPRTCRRTHVIGRHQRIIVRKFLCCPSGLPHVIGRHRRR